MNDPGLDKPINETSDRVEEEVKDQEDLEREEEQAYLDPSRWWFASTAFPLLAGTFGPMATYTSPQSLTPKSSADSSIVPLIYVLW